MTDELSKTPSGKQHTGLQPGEAFAPQDEPTPGQARPEDAAAKPEPQENVMLRTGTKSPDAADIEDPDRQL
jgi:hypothetical protein